MDDAASLGQRLKALRRQAKTKITQADLAFFLSDEGNAGYSTVSKIEHDKFPPRRATIAIYALLSVLTQEQIEQAQSLMIDLSVEK